MTMFNLTDDSIDSGTLVSGVKLNEKVARESLEARKLFESAASGSYASIARVQEAMTTSDFPVLLGVSYGRELLTEYQGITPVWQQFSARVENPNFKEHSLVEILGGLAGLELVPEATEYPARKVDESSKKFRVRKRGAVIPLTWEVFINDELGAFRGLPNRLAVAARETEDIVTVDALLNPSRTGLNTQFFRAANGNAPTALPLTRENVRTALAGIKARKVDGDRPLTFGTEKPVLLVPQALEEQARIITAPVTVRSTDSDGNTIEETNQLGSLVNVVVDPWLDVRNTGPNAATTWFILPAPSAPRKGLVTAFLRGHGNPDLRVKSDAGARPGGGIIAPEEGSFGDDTVSYRVRHVTDASTLDPTLTYASTGA
jgi:hypothetical protein